MCLLNIQVLLGQHNSVTEFMAMIAMDLVTRQAAAKCERLFNKPASGSLFSWQTDLSYSRKMFIQLTAGDNVIKPLSSPLMRRKSKLEFLIH